MTPDEILAEARRWNVDIDPNKSRILNFAMWVRERVIEDAAQACEAERIEWQGKRMFSESYAILCAADRVRALKEQP